MPERQYVALFRIDGAELMVPVGDDLMCAEGNEFDGLRASRILGVATAAAEQRFKRTIEPHELKSLGIKIVEVADA